MCIAEKRKRTPMNYFPILIPFFVMRTISTLKKKQLNKWTLVPREVCIPHAAAVLKELKPRDLLPPGVGD
jgi:hypothetical protein